MAIHSVWPLDLTTSIVASFLLFALAFLAGLRKSRVLLWTCVALGSLFAGPVTAILRAPAPEPELDAASGETVSLSGCIVDPPRLSEDRQQFTLELAPGARARVSLYLKEGEQPPNLSYGQNVEVVGRVRKPRNYQNEGAFDIQGFLARQRIFWQVAGRSHDPVAIQPGSCGHPALREIYRFRSGLLDKIDSLFGADAPKVAALLIGESAKLDRAWTDRFRQTGTYHALVVSGTHVTILAGILLLLLRALQLPEFAALLTTAALTWIYAIIAGGTAPVTRAAAGFTLFLVCRFFYREGRLLNLLAAVAIGFLLYDPQSLFDTSFQLSFGALAALCLIALPIDDRWVAPYRQAIADLGDSEKDVRMTPVQSAFRLELRLLAETVSLWTRVPLNVVANALSVALVPIFFAISVILASAAVQIGLALAFVVYFHRFAVTAVVANVAVVFLLEWAILVGFAAVFLGWLPLAKVTALLIEASARLAQWHLHWEPSWRIPSPPLWLGLAMAVSLAIFAATLRRRAMFSLIPAAAVVVLAAILLLHPFATQAAHSQLELTAIDVGQGDGLLVIFPDGTRMAVDAGGLPHYGKRKPMDIGEDVISPYLWSRSIRQLDILTLTHAHADHMGGMSALIDNFHPRELWISGMGQSEEFTRLLDHARAAGVAIRTIQAGYSQRFGEATVTAVSPPQGSENTGAPKNNDSLVLRASLGEHAFLLPGDAERSVEQHLAESPDYGKAMVLKVAHHGGRTSSIQSFLDATKPGFALISVGVLNRFGHPHPDVLERLEAGHATILRTDREGRVTIRTDGRRISVDTFRIANAGRP